MLLYAYLDRWPDKLDVTKRADFKSVKSSFLATPPNQVGYSELLNLILELEKANNNGKPACDSTAAICSGLGLLTLPLFCAA